MSTARMHCWRIMSELYAPSRIHTRSDCCNPRAHSPASLRICLTMLGMYVLFAHPGFAIQPFAITGTYWMDFSGIPVGKLWVDVRFDGSQCHTTAILKTTSVGRIFSKIKTETHGTATYTNGAFLPEYYGSAYLTKTASTEIAYRDGRVLSQSIVPPEDPGHRDPVTPEHSAGAWHPAMVLCAAQQLYAEGTPSIRLYDGKRLMQVHLQKVPGALKLSRELIAGFSQKELARQVKGDPPAQLVFSETLPVPQAVQVVLPYGTFNAHFMK